MVSRRSHAMAQSPVRRAPLGAHISSFSWMHMPQSGAWVGPELTLLRHESNLLRIRWFSETMLST